MPRFGTHSILNSLQCLDNGDVVAAGQLEITYDIGTTTIQQGLLIRTDSNGCLLDNCGSLAVHELPEPQLKMKLYPNPTNSTCTIKADEGNTIVSVVIHDALGRQVMPLFSNQQLSDFSFDCKTLSSGLYFVEVKDDKGDLEVLKLVKD